MLRDPHVRLLAVGAVLTVLATVLLITPSGAIGDISTARPILAVVAVMGLAMVCHNGIALAIRRRE
jgi:hypothetical protein